MDKLLDAESLLESVGMAHWLRQEDKIPEYEEMLTKTELLEWVRLQPKLTGTRWENFKEFLLKLRDEYEAMAKAGTGEEDTIAVGGDIEKGCESCKSNGRSWKTHTDRNCRFKEKNEREKKRTCWRCGSEGYISRDCPDKAAGVKKGNKQESHSNYLRARDCKWCGKEYKSDFTCSGCGTKFPAKSASGHCLAHCETYSAASAQERGNMVVKGKNCIICLHHEHTTDNCFGKDKLNTICSMGGCTKRHHPSLHSATQPSIQAVKTAGHVVKVGQNSGTIHGVEDRGSNPGDSDPGVEQDEVKIKGQAALLEDNLSGKFIFKLKGRRQKSNRVTWSESCETISQQQI